MLFFFQLNLCIFLGAPGTGTLPVESNIELEGPTTSAFECRKQTMVAAGRRRRVTDGVLTLAKQCIGSKRRKGEGGKGGARRSKRQRKTYCKRIAAMARRMQDTISGVRLGGVTGRGLSGGYGRCMPVSVSPGITRMWPRRTPPSRRHRTPHSPRGWHSPYQPCPDTTRRYDNSHRVTW